MNFKNSFILFLGFIALLGLAGCAHYCPHPIKKLASKKNQESSEKSITMATYVYTKADCRYFLDRNLIAKGYQPIQITITNNSSHTYKIAKENFSLPTVPSEIVAQSAHTNTVARALGYGIAAIFVFPFIIPAIVDSIGSEKANQKLDADFARKSLRDQALKPHRITNGLIFVANEDFDEDFTFTVIDQETGQELILTRKSSMN